MKRGELKRAKSHGAKRKRASGCEENQKRQVLKKEQELQRKRVRKTAKTTCSAERTLNWYDTMVSLHLARRSTVRRDRARRWAHIRLSLLICRSHTAGLNQQNPQSFRHECMQIRRPGTQPEYKSLNIKIHQTGAENPENSDTVNRNLRITIIRAFEVANVSHKWYATQKEPRWAALRISSRASSDYKAHLLLTPHAAAMLSNTQHLVNGGTVCNYTSIQLRAPGTMGPLTTCCSWERT